MGKKTGKKAAGISELDLAPTLGELVPTLYHGRKMLVDMPADELVKSAHDSIDSLACAIRNKDSYLYGLALMNAVSYLFQMENMALALGMLRKPQTEQWLGRDYEQVQKHVEASYADPRALKEVETRYANGMLKSARDRICGGCGANITQGQPCSGGRHERAPG